MSNEKHKKKDGIYIEVVGCHPKMVKQGGAIIIYPNGGATSGISAADVGEKCEAHGGHEPVIIIVDGFPVVIDPGDPGTIVCTDED